jgi:fatty acid desaturase
MAARLPALAIFGIVNRAMSSAPPLSTHHNSSPRTIWQDWPSYAFLITIAANVTLILHVSHTYWRIPLAVIQAFLLMGCQEAKHLCVHRTFLTPRWANDLVGFFCAALSGVNFFAYRHFHFAHHRHTCTARDPEGHLYALSWRTRWIWLLAPLEIAWVACHLNRQGRVCTPLSYRKSYHLGLLGLTMFIIGMAVLAFCFPTDFLWAFFIPMVLASWIDFLLTQAEHYGVAITDPTVHRNPDHITYNVVLPWLLSWMTLHRSLHRIHHRHPGMRWFHARHYLREETAHTLSYGAFAQQWLSDGPRLWQKA